jgi:hypothetical protein
VPAPCPQQQPSGLPAEKAMRARASPAMPALATTARDVHKEMHQGLVFEAAAGARPRGQEETKRPRGRAAADAPMIHEERESAERRSSPVCHPSLHRLPLHRLALQVNSYAILYAELRLRQGQLVALGRTLSTFRSDAKLRRQTVRQHWLETEVRFWEAVWRYKGGRWRP